MCGNKSKEWSNWIALDEYWFNASYHTTINNTSFQVVYGQPPPARITYSHGESPLEIVDRSLVARKAVIDLLKSMAKLLQFSNFDLHEFHCLQVEPFEIMDRRMAKRDNVAAVYVLVQWTNGAIDDSNLGVI
ncbi:retrotransposable element Tf2 [Tanacetum coccineum]